MNDQDLLDLLNELKETNALLSDTNNICSNDERQEVIVRLKKIANKLLVLQGELWLTKTLNF